MIITASCIINDETRCGIPPILILNGDFVHCIPLYPTILEDRNRLTIGMVFLRGTCIGGFSVACTSFAKGMNAQGGSMALEF